MAVFSKELCQKKLNTWMKAEEAIATGQSYQIGEQNADPSRFEAGSGGNGILGRETGRGVRRGEARGPEPELSGRGP